MAKVINYYLKYRLAILLVLVAILACLMGASPARTLESAESIPRLGDLAPPPPSELFTAPPVAPALAPDATVYTPSLDGKATWYGKALHGKLTASGEVFDMYRFTAAHRTLPFGTVLKVTNRANGKWVIVRVTDRGPIVHGRMMDLSYAAAKQLGMVGAGIARISAEPVSKQVLAEAEKAKAPKPGRSPLADRTGRAAPKLAKVRLPEK